MMFCKPVESEKFVPQKRGFSRNALKALGFQGVFHIDAVEKPVDSVNNYCEK